MKKIMISSFVILSLVSCSQYDEPPKVEDKVVNAEAVWTSELRSPGEAITIAQQAMSDFFPAKSRAASIVPLSGVRTITRRSSRESSDTVLYVVNFADNAGFALINAQRDGVSIYGVSDKGNYDDINLDANPPGLNGYIHTLGAILPERDSTLVLHPTLPPGGDKEPFMQQKLVKDTIENLYIAPKLEYNWGQSDCWGKFCSNGLCGCAPLALFNVLAYFKEPKTMSFGYPDAPFESVEMPWDYMKYAPLELYLDINTVPASGSSVRLTDVIGAFTRELGYRMGSKYIGDKYDIGPNSATSTYPEDCYQVVKDIVENQCPSLVTSELIYSSRFSPASIYSKLGLTIMGGYVYDGKNVYNGHAWVVDGYKGFEVKTTYYVKYDYEVSWRVFQEYTDSYRYAHVNWGWFGDANGWFYSDENGKFSVHSYDSENNLASPFYNYIYNYVKVEYPPYTITDPNPEFKL